MNKKNSFSRLISRKWARLCVWGWLENVSSENTSNSKVLQLSKGKTIHSLKYPNTKSQNHSQFVQHMLHKWLRRQSDQGHNLDENVTEIRDVVPHLLNKHSRVCASSGVDYFLRFNHARPRVSVCISVENKNEYFFIRFQRRPCPASDTTAFVLLV